MKIQTMEKIHKKVCESKFMYRIEKWGFSDQIRFFTDFVRNKRGYMIMQPTDLLK
jgi:hypothetical protein